MHVLKTSFGLQPKVVVHIDAEGTADPVPFGMGGPGAGGAPYVVIRVQPIAGELCRFAVSSCNEDDEREEDIVHTPSVPGRIVQTSESLNTLTDCACINLG